MTEWDFDKWWLAQDRDSLPEALRATANLCWLAGARAENERWVQHLVAQYAAGGRDAINPGLEG